MGIRCQCSITATGEQVVGTNINNEVFIGNLAVTATICPNCSPNTSFINVTYADNNNPNFNFTFNSTFVALPDCGTEEVTSSAQGIAVGVLFNGPATLSNIIFFPSLPNFICDITITANNNMFRQISCIDNATVVITSC
jgi:hypothetical protein